MFKSLLYLNGEISFPIIPNSWIKQMVVVAADGAYNTCRKHAINVDWVIGDGDSTKFSLGVDVKEYLDKSQDNTDFEKCLHWIQQNKLFPTCILGLGGGDLDHTLNNLYILSRWGGIHPMVAYTVNAESSKQICFRLPRILKCSMVPPQTVSILPITPMTVTTHGLRWELTNQRLSSDDISSVRNCVIESHMMINSQGQGVLTLSDANITCDAVKGYLTSFNDQ